MMMEPMWLWAILGVVLVSIEMAVGTFDILWFGVSAFCVAIAMWLFPDMSVAAQFTMYAALSLISLILWRSYYKKNEKHHRVGQAQGQEIGRVGTVFETCGPTQNGKIRFTQGLMGDREWTAVSNEPIDAGTDAEVTAVEGNALRIKSL